LDSLAIRYLASFMPVNFSSHNMILSWIIACKQEIQKILAKIMENIFGAWENIRFRTCYDNVTGNVRKKCGGF
jgi:hypothetical protein